MVEVEVLRQLVAETRTLLADQGGLGLQGLEVAPASLRPHQPPAEACAVPTKRRVTPAVGGTATLGGHAVPLAAPAASAAGPAAASDEDLAAIERDLGPCTRCPLAQTRTKLVFGAGAQAAKLVFVGEGPGRDEDRRGLPFVGEAGRLLDRMLAAMKLTRESVYITNVVKCRPPNNRYPEPNEQANCTPFLWRQLASIRPQVVVALGRLASQTLLATKAPIGKVRGQWQPLVPPQPQAALAEVVVMPTFHPAYLLRRPEDKILVWRDLQAVMARLASDRR